MRLDPLAGGAFAGGGVSAGRGRRVVVHLLPQPGDLVLGFEQALGQRRLAAERGRPGGSADAGAVLGHAVEIDQPLLAEDGDRVRQQGIEDIHVADAEVGEGVVVDGDAAAQPAEGVVLGAQGGQCAGGADALKRSVQPQGDGQSGIEGGPPGVPLAGPDGVGQRQIESAAELPDDAGLVVLVEQSVDGSGVEHGLTIRGSQARRG